MLVSPTSVLRSALFLAGCVILAPPVLADSFVPAGAAGVLEVEVTVQGNGSETAQPGAGLKSRGWSVDNKASYRVAMQAQAPVINGEQTGSTAAGSNPTSEAEWEKKWEAKTAACKGDPNCEMQVAMEQASDPHSVQQMKELSSMAAAARSSPGGAPNAQVWDAVSRTGPVSIHEEDNSFGVISETGGLVDVKCTIALDKQMNALPPNPTGTLPPTLTINGSNSTYTLYLPLEDGFEISRVCNNGRETSTYPSKGTVSLIGSPPAGGGSWSTILTANGSVANKNGVLAFDGHKTVQARVLGYDNRMATVTIKWQFTGPAQK